MEKKFPRRLKIYWMDLSVVNTLLWGGRRAGADRRQCNAE